jgi:hypothetical protein
MTAMDAFNIGAGICSILSLIVALVTLTKVVKISVSVGDVTGSSDGSAFNRSSVKQVAKGNSNKQTVG